MTARRCSPSTCPTTSRVMSPISAAAGATCRARSWTRSAGVVKIDLIDAEHRAIEAARANVAEARAAFHWLDLTQEATPATYDAVICNPPFHAGRAAEPGLGQTVIAAAARSLRPGGPFLHGRQSRAAV